MACGTDMNRVVLVEKRRPRTPCRYLYICFCPVSCVLYHQAQSLKRYLRLIWGLTSLYAQMDFSSRSQLGYPVFLACASDLTHLPKGLTCPCSRLLEFTGCGFTCSLHRHPCRTTQVLTTAGNGSGSFKSASHIQTSFVLSDEQR